MPDRTRARELAAEFIRKGDPTGWFEPLYQEAEAGKSTVPWVDLCPNPHLLGFWNAHPLQAIGKSALVIGCALGDDAEQLADWGFQTTAFDISETAIRAAKKRCSNSQVEYVAADLFAPPASWHHNFDFVLEIYTLQTLPAALRPPAINKMTEFLRPAGLLLLIARGREPSDPEGQLPWPLTRAELSAFQAARLKELSFEDLRHPEDPTVRRFRVLYAAKSV
jgi:ubiquinone/menaquinone biosynthesis C-methylase UbiE